MTLFLPRRRTLRALDFITVLPKLTWPSPATTTWLPLRTERIVVPCHWRGEFSDMDCQMGKSGGRVQPDSARETTGAPGSARCPQIGRATDRNPVPNAQRVCPHLLAPRKQTSKRKH